jgi:putative transposase
VTYETVRRWAQRFGQQVAKNIRHRCATFGDKWHLDEVAIKINGRT